MQSKSDMSDSQHVQYCLAVHAQRSCTVSTSLASDLLNMRALSAHMDKSDFSQYVASCASRKTPMATEIQGKPCHVCSSYEKLYWPYNNMTHPVFKQDIPYYMGSSAPSDIYFCYHAMLWLPRRVQRSTSAYVHDVGGQKTQCDYLIFN